MTAADGVELADRGLPLGVIVVAFAIVGVALTTSLSFGLVLIAIPVIAIIWLWPAAGLVMLPAVTLLIPEIPVSGRFRVNANIFLMATFAVAAVVRADRLTLPRRYSIVLFLAFVVSFLSTIRGILTFSRTGPSQLLYLFQWVGYLSLPVLGVIVARQLSHREWERVYRATLLSAAFGSILIVAHLITVHFGVLPAYAGGEEIEVVAHRHRLRTIWTQGPNATGMFLAIQAIFGFTLTLRSESRRMQVSAGLYGLLTASLMLFTYSRSAFVALLSGVVVISLIVRWRATVGLVSLGGLIFAILPDFVRARFLPTDLFRPRYIEPLGYSLPVGPLAKRVSLWTAQIDEFLVTPLFGQGFYPVAIDSTYVNLTVGTGIIGLVLHLVLFALLSWFCYATYQVFEGRDPLRATVSIATLGSLLGFYAWAIFSEVFARWRILGLLFSLVALSVGSLYRDTFRDESVGVDLTTEDDL